MAVSSLFSILDILVPPSVNSEGVHGHSKKIEGVDVRFRNATGTGDVFQGNAFTVDFHR